MKKIIAFLLTAAMGAAVLAGCGTSTTGSSSGEGSDTTPASQSQKESSFDTGKAISVITREEGSGTRDAFVELTGVLVKDEDGNKTDNTTLGATTINSTQAVMSNVAGDEAAIGYISLGSLNDTVKALKVDGVAPSAETVKDGTYKIARPFNVAVKKDAKLSDAAQDFMNYILSDDGQAIVEKEGYVSVEKAGAFEGGKAEGKIVVAGSSSVSPVMEKLKEAYEALNSKVTIELQTTDSSSGMTAATEGTCDIGMASRELKDEEVNNLTSTKIAMDGIAVIVNNANTCEDVTMDQVASIFKGETAVWSDIVK